MPMIQKTSASVASALAAFGIDAMTVLVHTACTH